MAGSWLDSLGGLFGDQKNTTTTGQQSGTTSSTGTNFANTNQAGRTGSNYDWAIQGGIGGLPNAFAPGIATGQSIAQFGLDPNSIAAFANPYLKQSLQAQTDLANQQQGITRSGIKGLAAQQGALTGSGVRGATAQSDALSNLNLANINAAGENAGFNAAAGLANQSLQARMGGASLANQGVGAQYGALGNLIGLGGQNYANTGAQAGGQSQTGAFSGQSSGTSDTTIWNPFGTLAGVAGGAAKVLPFLRDGGTVPGFAFGGGIGEHSSMPHHNPHMHKLMGTLEPLLHTMKKAMRNGGEIKGYDDGGDVGYGSSWDAKVTPESSSFGSKLGNAFDAFSQGYRSFQPQRQPSQAAPAASDDNGIGARMQDLAKGFASIRGYAGGGVPDPWKADVAYERDQELPGELLSAPPPTEAPSAPMQLGARGVPPPSSGGGIFSSVRDYFAAPDRQKALSYLASMHGSPFAPSEANALASREDDLKAAHMLQEAGIAAGQVNYGGKTLPTVAAQTLGIHQQKLPLEMEVLKSGTIQGKIDIAQKEKENALELGRQDMALKWEQVMNLLRQQKAEEDARTAAGSPKLPGGRYRVGPDGQLQLVPSGVQ